MRHLFPITIVLFLTACGTDGPKVDPDTGADDGGRDVGTAEDTGGDDASMTQDTGGGDDLSASDMAGAEDMPGAEDMTSDDVSGPDMAADVGADLAPDADPMGDGDTCDTAIEATTGGTFTGDTSMANDDYSASALDQGCPSGTVSGGDIVYLLEPATETTYDITVTPDGAAFDPFLYIRADCSADECVDGTVLNGAGTPESLTGVTVPANTAYYVIVDGELASSGAYTLEIEVQ